MGRLSKTARASLGQRGEKGQVRVCPECEAELVPTKVMGGTGIAKGMYWITDKETCGKQGCMYELTPESLQRQRSAG